MSIGHKGAIQAAKIIAMAGSELLQNKELLEQAKEEFAKATEGQPYKCPVPADVAPPLDQLPKH